MNREFLKWKFRRWEFLKILAHKSRFSAFEAQTLWCQETQSTNFFRDDSSLAESRREASRPLGSKGDLSSEIRLIELSEGSTLMQLIFTNHCYRQRHFSRVKQMSSSQPSLWVNAVRRLIKERHVHISHFSCAFIFIQIQNHDGGILYQAMNLKKRFFVKQMTQIVSEASEVIDTLSNCGFTSNLCTWRSMTTSMQVGLVRWVVFYSVPS
jgi:hypothetical protein